MDMIERTKTNRLPVSVARDGSKRLWSFMPSATMGSLFVFLRYRLKEKNSRNLLLEVRLFLITYFISVYYLPTCFPAILPNVIISVIAFPPKRFLP